MPLVGAKNDFVTNGGISNLEGKWYEQHVLMYIRTFVFLNKKAHLFKRQAFQVN